jgi:type II secretory pathway pseudopilin PulG
VELLVVISIIGLLIAILLPAIAKARDNALINQSRANLRNLGVANSAYWGDFQDRQPTFMRDDWGSLPPCGDAGGCTPQNACTNYQNNYGCISQMILGFAASGGIWGYWVTGPNCGFNVSTTCAQNACIYVPMCFTGGDAGFGSFRMPNIKSFATYLNGRYYDPVFFAPKDRLTLDVAERYFGLPDEFTYDGSNIGFSSYCWSPAAMWNPEVFGGTNAPPCNNFKSPHSPGTAVTQRNPNAYRSPSSSQAKYPSLKTLMIEHNWLQNPPPQLANPFFAGGTEPWYFNQGYNSNPACLFFDLHIEMKGAWQAMDADRRATAAYGGGQCNQRGALWARDTPLGATGYYGGQSYDFLVNTSFHILTRNGVAGRDFLTESGGS